MKIETASICGVIICLALLLSAHVIASETERRQKREFRPIEPKQILKQKNLELPEKDPNRIYYGPDGALFPELKIPKSPQIQFDSK